MSGNQKKNQNQGIIGGLFGQFIEGVANSSIASGASSRAYRQSSGSMLSMDTISDKNKKEPIDKENPYALDQELY